MPEASWWRAVAAAGTPATPAPITTTSAERSQLRRAPLWALASRVLPAASATPAAPVDRKARRLTSPEATPARSVVFLPMFPPGRFKGPANAKRRVGKGALLRAVPTRKGPRWARFALPTLLIDFHGSIYYVKAG